MWAILSGTEIMREGRPDANAVGASARLPVCDDCQSTLSMSAVGAGFQPPNGALNGAIPPNDALIVAAKAAIAAAKLAGEKS